MLFALRSGTFTRDVIPAFTVALKTVVKSNFSTEVVRTLATFVTSFSQRGHSLQIQRLISGKFSKPATPRIGSTSPVKRSSTVGEETELPKRKRKQSDLMSYEVVVLEMLVDILLSSEKRYINKFATTITSKVRKCCMRTKKSGPSYLCQAQIPIISSTE
jgi:beige protein homolog 1